MTQNDSLPPVEGPEYTPCACSHIEPEHDINGRWCAMDDCPCSLYRPEPAAVAPPADQAGLRKRIAEALWKAAEHSIVAEWICCDPINPKHQLCVQGDAALRMVKALILDDPEAYKPAPLPDAVLAVLPAPDQQAAELDRLRTENARMRHELEVMYGGAYDTLKAAPDERAAVLREAADALPGADLPFVPPMDRRRVADWLRRLAGETQQDRCPSCDHDTQVMDHEGAHYWVCMKCGTNLGRIDSEAQQDPAPGGETVPWGVCPDCRAAAGPDCDCPPYSDEQGPAPARSGQPDTNQET